MGLVVKSVGLLCCRWGGIACVKGDNGLDYLYAGVGSGMDVLDMKFDS